MKIAKYIGMFVALLAVVSCEKHVIEFDMEHVDESTTAELQIHYYVPKVTSATNNIYKVEINDMVIVNNNSSVIATNNAIPSGATGLFYAVPAGDVRLRLYLGVDCNLAYDRTFKVSAGKQNVFVYDFNQDPKVISTGYPLTNNSTYETDSVFYVRFYNFVYEDADTYYPGKIQYQYRYKKNWGDKDYTEWENIGTPVGFGESTDWSEVKMNQPGFQTYGSMSVYYRMLDENGDVLQYMNSSKRMVDYSDYWTAYVGRRYMHIYRGLRLGTTPTSAVSQFTEK